jgi:YafQ family addiction module toxin component
MNSYSQDIDDELVLKLKKLAKRDKALYTAVQKKMVQIAENPYLGKPLHGKLKGKRRVHIGHFVLIYGISEEEHKVVFLEFAHHDEAYK